MAPAFLIGPGRREAYVEHGRVMWSLLSLPNASVLLQAASSPAHGGESADDIDGRLPLFLAPAACQQQCHVRRRPVCLGRGHERRRADSGARWWALIMMPPSRWFLAGAQLLARMPAGRCSLQRGA